MDCVNTDESNDSLEELATQLCTHLRGCSGLPIDWCVQAPVVDSNVLDSTDTKIKIEVASSESSERVSLLNWNELTKVVHECRACRLCETRNNVVFGVGRHESPSIAFVGEGPGADEDLKGEPFVGKAGELLTAAITKGLKLQRSDVFITNIVKCRPPNNRTPLPDEVQACLPYLRRQLSIIQPKVIVTLGNPALQAMTGLTCGITKVRGQWQMWDSIRLMPTFHPAYILRNPSAKRPFWEDLQLVMAEIGLNPERLR